MCREIPKIAWLPQWIDYIPTEMGIDSLGGKILNIDCASFSNAISISNTLNIETKGNSGFYTAFNRQLPDNFWPTNSKFSK